MTKYYRTLILIDVLSNEPIPDDYPLDSIRYEIEEGAWSGKIHMPPSHEISEDLI